MSHATLSGPDGLFTVSRAPRFLHESGKVGWEGAYFTDLFAASSGAVDHRHERHCLQRSVVPFKLREARGSWTVVPAGANLWQPGQEQRHEWEGGGGRQFLFLSLPRAEEIADGRSLQGVDGSHRGPCGSPLVGLILDAMVSDLAQGSPAGALVGDSLIVALFSHLLGAVNARAAQQGLTRSARDRVVEYIDAHLSEAVTLREMAQVASLGERQFCRAFRASIGESPHQYLLGQRVERAKSLILKGDSLADVALQSGFSDQSQLTRTFTRRLGVSPATYRAVARA